MLMILETSQNFTYYAGIMLDATAILLCSKLCWHNWLKPTDVSTGVVSMAMNALHNSCNIHILYMHEQA